MALLSHKMIEEIIDVAESYARQEKARMSQLDADGKPMTPSGHRERPARPKSQRDRPAS